MLRYCRYAFASSSVSSSAGLIDIKLGCKSMWYLWLKRVIDVLVASTTLVLCIPVFLLVVPAIWFFLGSPVLYSQNRPGKNGVPFRLVKFRSMTDARDADGELLPDDVRTTAFGQFLRATSLDELPELFNVLKGDMSLVGPRPLLMEYLPLYDAEQVRRHDVRPGITGHAQVSGRNALSWDEKFKLDIFYVDNVSLLLDLQILWKTIMVVFSRQGISSSGHTVGMDRFTGGKSQTD